MEFGCKKQIILQPPISLRISCVPLLMYPPKATERIKKRFRHFLEKSIPKENLFNYGIVTFGKNTPLPKVFSADLEVWPGLVLIGFRRWGWGCPFVGILQVILHILKS